MLVSSLVVRQLTLADAQEIVAWHYPSPYELYNTPPDEQQAMIVYLLAPENRCFAIKGTDSTLIGFVSLGQDARVPGGDYSANALDLGIGIRPDLTGRGEGRRFLAVVVEFAQAQNPPPEHLRVTVAAFNERAQRLVRGAGFVEVQRFTHPGHGAEFVILVR